MYRIVRRRELNPTVTQIEVEAPLVARKAKPGQFIILRVDEDGERIPLTVAGTDPKEGTVRDREAPRMVRLLGVIADQVKQVIGAGNVIVGIEQLIYMTVNDPRGGVTLGKITKGSVDVP